MNWISCPSCEEEFKVVNDNIDSCVEYCPFCGCEIYEESEEDEDYDNLD